MATDDSFEADGRYEVMTVAADHIGLGDILMIADARVIKAPIHSHNQLFGTSQKFNCVVIGVEYEDGSRGSRLYKPNAKLKVARPYKDEEDYDDWD